MSDSDTGANEPHDDEQHGAEAQTGDSAETETITDLTEAQQRFKQLEQRRETRRYDVSGPGDEPEYVTFTVRALRADERDAVESVAAREQQKADGRSRTGQSGDMDIWTVKRAQLEHGIVDSSLEGFSPNREDHLKSLPTSIQDDLFTAIDELGQIEKEVVDGFQGMG